ncbi:MAG TPA: GNAT family N-acetyltransferase [Rhodanobacteraceae bacterium]
MSEDAFLIRLADPDDDDFILGLVPRFTDFPLPPWRRRNECIGGIREDIAHHLADQPAGSFMFIAEDRGNGQPVGFIHLKKVQDFFNGRTNCHISDLAVAPDAEGRGIGRALMDHAGQWAREHHCHMLTLAVFPGNERARKLYAGCGFDVDLLRLVKPVT